MALMDRIALRMLVGNPGKFLNIELGGANASLPISRQILSNHMNQPTARPNPRRWPFTISMVSLLVVCGVFTDSHLGSLSVPVRRAFGSSLLTILEGDVIRFATSLCLTSGGWHFWVSVLMLAICVGYAEWNYGTLRTMGVFFGVHLITLIVISVGLLLAHGSGQFAATEWLLDARDVGPSAGYYGCLGFVVGGVNANWRSRMIFGVLFVLMIRVGVSINEIGLKPHLVIGDAAHLIAFPMGLGLKRIG